MLEECDTKCYMEVCFAQEASCSQFAIVIYVQLLLRPIWRVRYIELQHTKDEVKDQQFPDAVYPVVEVASQTKIGFRLELVVGALENVALRSIHSGLLLLLFQ